MDRGIDAALIMLFFNNFRVYGQIFHHGDIRFVNVLSNHGNIGFPSTPFYFIHGSDLLNFLYDILIVRGYELTAVVTVRLITIVFLGVMAGRTNDPALAMKLPDGKAQ